MANIFSIPSRLLRITLILFYFSGLIFFSLLFFVVKGNFDTFVINHSVLTIDSIDPSCLEIVKISDKEWPFFNIENKCQVPFKVNGTEYIENISSEKILLMALNDEKYTMVYNESFFDYFKGKRWEINGLMGEEPLIIKGKARGELIYFTFLITGFIFIISFVTFTILLFFERFFKRTKSRTN